MNCVEMRKTNFINTFPNGFMPTDERQIVYYRKYEQNNRIRYAATTHCFEQDFTIFNENFFYFLYVGTSLKDSSGA